MDGFINIRKEAGWTSHDVVARLRRILGLQKIGHAGTLDPPAEGVLLVATGRACRLLEYLGDLSKTYVAEVLFGTETDTQDLEGTVLRRQDVSPEVLASLPAVLERFTGPIEQHPPMYSAVKVGGQRLYRLAREGKTVERPVRTVQIHRAGVLRAPWCSGDGQWRTLLEIHCSSGTYVRTLCQDVCRAMGTIGVLSYLVRSRVGTQHINRSYPLARVEETVARGDRGFLLSMESLLVAETGMPRWQVPETAQEAIRQGRSLVLAQTGGTGPLPPPGRPCLLADRTGQLLAVAVADAQEPGRVRMKKVLI